jgi:two-component system phosphate regulon response regulator PhoB
MGKAKILVVDDDPDLLRLVRYNLEREGFQVVVTAEGDEALRLAKSEHPQLIVLDLMLPDGDGLEVCRQLKRREETWEIPIVMLTAKGEEVDRVVGFEMGADDYLTKPFSPRELVLRIKAVLKRCSPSEKPPRTLQAGELLLDLDRRQAWIGQVEILLTYTEFELLKILVLRKGRVQSRETLLSDVWRYQPDIDSRTVDTHIKRLRSKLGDRGEAIETVRGVGYRLREDGV